MPTFDITSPDGRKFTVEGPEGATAEQALAQVQQQQTPEKKNLLQKMDPTGGYMWDAATGIVQGGTSLAQMGARALHLPTGGIDKFNNAIGQVYGLTKPEERTGSSLVRGAAPMIAAAPLLPEIGAASGAMGLVRALGSGAMAGGVGGALEPVADSTTPDFAKQKLQQAGQGALAGGLTAGAGNMLGGVVSPVMGPMQKILADAKIRMTPGQASGGLMKDIEDKATSIPVLGTVINNARKTGVDDFNRALYTRALAPFGDEGAAVAKAAPIGRNGIEHVGEFLSQKYEDALAKAVPSPLDAPFQSAVGKIATMVPQALQNDFVSALRNTLQTTPAGTLTPSVAKAADSQLKSLAGAYKGSSVAGERQMGYALDQTAAEVRSLMGRYQTGEVSQQLANADKGWATLAQIERAGSSTLSNGVITPAQYLASIKRGDTSVRDRKFAQGNMLNQDLAEAAKGVLPNKVPDSGTTGRALMAMALEGGIPAAAGLAHPLAGLAAGASMLPYLPIIGPAIQGARQSAPAQAAAAALRKYAPALGLLGAGAFAP